jgi:hypothetical protein
LDQPAIIGWKEYVDFPAWRVRRVKAKIDTGARTSAIHVVRYQLYEQEDQGPMAELQLSLYRQQPERLTVVRTPVLRMATVTDSGGHQELRPVVVATIRLGPVTKQVAFTVTNRASMLFRMLLGRKALEGDFLVDVSQKYRMLRG